jgi:arginyl-tRNA synthetase
VNPAELSASLLAIVSAMLERRGSTETIAIGDVALERPR